MTAVSPVSRGALEQQGRGIVERLGGKWSNGTGMCRCPAHDDRSPSLSVRIGDRSLFFHCFSGCDTRDVLRALRRGGTIGSGGILSTDEAGAGRYSLVATSNLQSVVTHVWDSASKIEGTAAADYLSGRGIVSHSAQLRYHPHVQLGPKRNASWHRAMLAAVRDHRGALIAVHRTFLDPIAPKRAGFDSPRRLLGLPGQGAVQLDHSGSVAGCPRVLGLAEGTETALAASMIHKIPVWAVLGNERFGMVSIPAHVTELVILADNDAGGQRAAQLALDGQQRGGRALRVVWPPAGFNDWADVLAGKGRRGGG